MKLAASNLTFPPFDHRRLLPCLGDHGVTGLEVAPFHTWPDARRGIAAKDVKTYRRIAELAGLQIIGLHGLTDGALDLAHLTIPSRRRRLTAQLVEFSAICRDLGGRTLILEGRRRGELAERDAWIICREFLEDLLPRIESHGTVLCFAPLTPDDGDFCATARECYMLTNAVDHASFGLHLGAAALASRGKIAHATFAAARGRLELFHIDEPGRGILGGATRVDHTDVRRHLVASTYAGWASVVQTTGSDRHHPKRLAKGFAFVAERYGAATAQSGALSNDQRSSLRSDLEHHR